MIGRNQKELNQFSLHSTTQFLSPEMEIQERTKLPANEHSFIPVPFELASNKQQWRQMDWRIDAETTAHTHNIPLTEERGRRKNECDGL